MKQNEEIEIIPGEKRVRRQNLRNAFIALRPFFTPLSVLFSGIIIAVVFFFGFRSIAACSFSDSSRESAVAGENSDSLGTGNNSGENEGAGQAAPAVGQSVTTTIGDDPILGNKESAQIAIVESFLNE